MSSIFDKSRELLRSLKNKAAQKAAYVASSPILNKLAVGNINRFYLPESRAQNPVLRTSLNIAKGIPESFINIPRNLIVGPTRIATEINRSRATGQTLNMTNVAAGVAPFAEGAFDLATLGFGKSLAKSAVSQLGKQGLKSSAKTGAKTGLGIGGFGGLAYGLDEQYNKKFNLGEVATTTGAGALLGGVLGGAMGSVGSVKGMLTKKGSRIDRQLQARTTDGRFTFDEPIVKPKGMPQAAWKFQLKFNETYGRHPLLPVYESDFQEALRYEAGKRIPGSGQLRDINEKPLSTSQPKGVGAQTGLKDVPQLSAIRPTKPGRYTNVRQIDNPLLKNVASEVPMPQSRTLTTPTKQSLLPETEKYLPNKEAIRSTSGQTKPISSTEDYIRELKQKQSSARDSGNAGIKVRTKNFLAELKAKLVDETSPIQDVLSEAEKTNKFRILPKNDIRLQIDRVLRSKTLASQFAEDNGLVDVIKKAEDLDVLDQYMIAKQALNVEKNGIKTGRDLARDQQLINDLAPKYEQMAQQVNQYSRKLLDYSVKSGLIDEGLAKELVQKYPNYVPLNRVFNELEKATPRGTGKGVASVSKQTVVQRLKGSDREITSPIESLLLKTQDAFNQGERNIAAKQLASYKNLPGFEGLIKEIEPGSLAPHTFSYIDNGVKKTFATTKEIEAAAKALNVEQMGLLGKILSGPTRVLQLGATGLNIPFVVTNMVKDEITGFVNSNRAAKTSILNPMNYLKSLFSAVKHDKLYKEVIRNAAGGTSFDIAREAPNLAVKRIRKGNTVGYIAKNPGELLRALENIVGRSEEVGRIKNYKGTLDALIKEGRTPQDARLLAAKAARENTANFARRGSWGRVLNWVIPFFNAGIQGARQVVTSFSTRPAQTSAKIAMTMFTPVAVATAWNLSDPQRKTIYQDIPNYEKENNIIIIPENPTQDAKGRWNVIKIPLPPGLSNLTSLVRRPMEQAEGLDPVRFGEIATNLITAGTSIDVSSSNKIASTFTPQIAKPFVEGVTNTNLFTGQEIVPSYLKNRLPEDQVKAGTTPIARGIGKALNISPLMVENFAQSQLGGLGSQLIGKESAVGNLERRFSKVSSGATVNKIYDNAEKYSALDSKIKELVKTGRKDEARRVIEENKELLMQGEVASDFKSKLSEYYSDRNKVLNSQTLTQEQKDRILLAIQKKISETSSMYTRYMEKR